MRLHHGDCLDVMAAMEPESVDAIVTDPPYGLEFMGKEWDRFRVDDPGTQRNRGERASGGAMVKDSSAEPRAKDNPWQKEASGYKGGDRPTTSRCTGCGKRDQWRNPHPCTPDAQWKSLLIDPHAAPPTSLAYQEWTRRWALEAYRVAKPSAYLLAFGGTRTVHRMTVALEDAGWIIRDMLVWGYASGFPKSKASLKPAWEPIVMARKPGPLRMLNIDECRIGVDGGTRAVNFGANRGDKYGGGAGKPTNDIEDIAAGRWPANIVLTDPIFDGGVEGVVGGGIADAGTAVRRNVGHSPGRFGFASGSQDAEMREDVGYGDSGTYSRFFLIPKADRTDREPVLGGLPEKRKADDGPILEYVHDAPEGLGGWLRKQREAAGLTRKQVAAHFPSRTGGLTGCVTNWEEEYNRPTPDQWRKLREVIGFDDRYDVAMTEQREVSLAERDARSQSQNLELMRRVAGLGKERANHHPTVKPTDLMRHLVRLVTPPGGVVLDPFLGSGTTALAAEMEGFDWIGIEREAEYVAIAEARLNGTQRGLGLGA